MIRERRERFYIVLIRETIVSANLKLSLIFAGTTGEFLISSVSDRIAAITAAAISLALSVLANCRQ
jgi:hypothetical protein